MISWWILHYSESVGHSTALGCHVCQNAACCNNFSWSFSASFSHFLLTFPPRDKNTGKNDKKKQKEKKILKGGQSWGRWLERQIGQTLHRILQHRKWVWTLNNELHIWACSSCLNAAEVSLRSNVSAVKTKNKNSQHWVDPLFFLTLSILPSYLITAQVQNTLIPHVLHSWEGFFARLHFPFSNTDN